MEDKEILEQIAQYRRSRETFEILDRHGLWHVKIMIIWIRTHKTKDDIVKIIDMWELQDSFDVIDYEISLTDLVKARKLLLNE